MRTVYGPSIPPGVESATRGHLKVRVDRVVLDLSPVSSIVGDDAARHIVENPHLSFHFWGGEKQRSPVIAASSLVTRAHATNLIFPIKTNRQQIEAYFGHMSTSRSGLEIRVLAHDVITAAAGSSSQSGGNISKPCTSASHEETAMATIGRSLIRLEEVSPGHVTAGWFSVLALPEDSKGFAPIALTPAHAVLGRIKLCITVEYFASPAPGGTATGESIPQQHPLVTFEQQHGEQRAARRPVSPPHEKTGRLKETLPPPIRGRSEKNGSNTDDDDNGEQRQQQRNQQQQQLVVIGKGIAMPGLDGQQPQHEQAEKQTQSPQPPARKPPVPRSRSSSAEKKPTIPAGAGGGSKSNHRFTIGAAGGTNNNNNKEDHKLAIDKDADQLFRAGIQLRQQLADAAKTENVNDIMDQQRNKKMKKDSASQQRSGENCNNNNNKGNDDDDDDDDNNADPYRPLSLRLPPNSDVLVAGGSLLDNNINDSDEDDDDDDNAEHRHGFHYFDPVTFGNRMHGMNAAGTGGKSSSKKHRHHHHHHQQHDHDQRTQHRQPVPIGGAHDIVAMHQFQHQQQQRAASQAATSMSGGAAAASHLAGAPPTSRPSPAPVPPFVSPSSSSHMQQTHYVLPRPTPTPTGGGGGGGGSTPLNGSFIARVCIGQLALQAPCHTVKLVARFSPDVLFTSPPALGCFVSPDVELPIADDDVVGFNVAGIRRLSTASRVVVELYAKHNKKMAASMTRTATTNPARQGGEEDDDDFQLVGLCMVPICGSAATSGGVLKNVALRNPLSAGTVQGQCDVYVTFFQEEEFAAKQKAPAPVLPPGVKPFVGFDETYRPTTAATAAAGTAATGMTSSSEANNNNKNHSAVAADGAFRRKSPSPAASSSSASSTDLVNQHHGLCMSENGEACDRNRNSGNRADAALVLKNNNTGAGKKSTTTTANNNTLLRIRISEARNLRPIKDGDASQQQEQVVAPSCFAIIDDVMLMPGNSSICCIGSPAALPCVEMPSVDWQVNGPDATFIADPASATITSAAATTTTMTSSPFAPRFSFETTVEVGDGGSGSDCHGSSTLKQLSRICISVHHCRSKELVAAFSSASSSTAATAAAPDDAGALAAKGILLDPERDERIVDLLRESVELGVISVPTKTLSLMPFDGWAHAIDSVTGDSVGQFRIRCELLRN